MNNAMCDILLIHEWMHMQAYALCTHIIRRIIWRSFVVVFLLSWCFDFCNFFSIKVCITRWSGAFGPVSPSTCWALHKVKLGQIGGLQKNSYLPTDPHGDFEQPFGCLICTICFTISISNNVCTIAHTSGSYNLHNNVYNLVVGQDLSRSFLVCNPDF